LNRRSRHDALPSKATPFFFSLSLGPKLKFCRQRSLFFPSKHLFFLQRSRLFFPTPACSADYHARTRLAASSPLTAPFFRQKEGRGSELGEGDAKNAGPAYGDSGTASPTFLGRISGSGPNRFVEQKTEPSPSRPGSAARGAPGFNSSPRFKIRTPSITRALRERVSPSERAPSFRGDGDLRPSSGGLPRLGLATAWGGGERAGWPGPRRPTFEGGGGRWKEAEGGEEEVGGDRGGFLRRGFAGVGGRDPKASTWRRFRRQSCGRSTSVA
ncbi:unnamed protein product, partial [Musa textilis]